VNPPTRAATNADHTAIRALFRRSAVHWESDRAWLLANPQHLEWDGAALERARVYDDGSIRGFSSWELVDGVLEVVDLFVEPDAMGRGVGRALIVDLTNVARELGAQAMEVTGNPNALGFYLAVGFEVTGERATPGGPGMRLRYSGRPWFKA
jgi:GNAT superfamily N-acetyltransferase